MRVNQITHLARLRTGMICVTRMGMRSQPIAPMEATMSKIDTFKGKYYCTSFCNQTHRLHDGMPVNHECYVLNPKGLTAEMTGDYTFQPFRTERVSRGIKVTWADE